MKTWTAGEYCKVRCLSGRGYWYVQVAEVSTDGKFAKVRSTGRAFGSPRWVETAKLVPTRKEVPPPDTP